MSVASVSTVVSKWLRKMQGLFVKSETQDLSRRILNLYDDLAKTHEPEFVLLICLADPEVDHLQDPENGIAKLYRETWQVLDKVVEGSAFLEFSPESFQSFMSVYFDAYESINGTHKKARTKLGVTYGKLTERSENKLRSFMASVIKQRHRSLRALIWSMQVMLRQKRTVF